ncbi:hypothetical protein V5799_034472 [Amblyomma americanum]|uniref:Uncharacterized protein n=1 Tax=Amblyomma americanum TaxID=6943 RepID=A0AAQ4DKD0_AMBAM
MSLFARTITSQIKVEGPQEPLEYDGVPLPDKPVQQLSGAVKNGDPSDEEMYENPETALSRSRKDDYVRSCSRLTVVPSDKISPTSSHDQVVKSMRSLHKGAEPEFAEAAVPAIPALPAIPSEEPEVKNGLLAVSANVQSSEDKEGLKSSSATANGATTPNLHITSMTCGQPPDFKFKMTLRDRGNLRKPMHLVRPAPFPEDVEKAKDVKREQLEDGTICYPLMREVMVPVMRYLRPQDLSQCQLVCKEWNRWCVEPGMWRRVDLSRRRVTALALAGIVRRQPCCLDLAWTNVSAKQLSWLLPRLPHLRELGLSGCSAAAVVAALRSGVCPRLRCLDLSWVEGLGDQAVRDLVAPDARSKPRLLVEVRLAGCDISDVAVRLLGHQLPNLSRLDLSNCRGVTDMGIAVLGAAKATRLTALDVSRCANVSDTGLEALRRCVGLRHLDLRDCPQVTDSACRRFVAQSRLPVVLKESKLIQVASP